MDNGRAIEIIDMEGNKNDVFLVTYLVSDDNLKHYIVYTKNEIRGAEGDQIIYISRLFKDREGLKIQEIVDDGEWNEVQRLLKKIANV